MFWGVECHIHACLHTTTLQAFIPCWTACAVSAVQEEGASPGTGLMDLRLKEQADAAASLANVWGDQADSQRLILLRQVRCWVAWQFMCSKMQACYVVDAGRLSMLPGALMPLILLVDAM